MTLDGVITTPRWLLSIRLGYRGLLSSSHCATWDLLCDNQVMLFIVKLFVSKFVFYVVLFELSRMVKKFVIISFVTIRSIGSYRSSVTCISAITKQSARFMLL